MKPGEAGQTSQRIAFVPSVANGLKVVVRGGEFAVWAFSLDNKSRISEVRAEREGIIGTSVTWPYRYCMLNVNLLFKWVFLYLMVNIPAERNNELVDIVLARLGFLILGRDQESGVGLEVVR